MTDAEQAFLTMAKMAGIEPLVVSNQQGPKTLFWPGFEIRLEDCGAGTVLITNFQVTGRTNPHDNATITRMIETFQEMTPFVFEERFPFMTAIWSIRNDPSIFPIVASTFEALTIERPELREHYDRAKEAWEASQ